MIIWEYMEVSIMGLEIRVEVGRVFLDFMVVYNLVIVNFYFKREMSI